MTERRDYSCNQRQTLRGDRRAAAHTRRRDPSRLWTDRHSYRLRARRLQRLQGAVAWLFVSRSLQPTS
jgi:hypothetical protein